MRNPLRFVALVFAMQPLAAQERTLFDFGHLDIDWTYASGEWSAKLVWDEEFPVIEVEPTAGVLVAKDKPYSDGEGSRLARPSGTEWDFTGAAQGDDIWVLPSATFGDPILEPGFATNGVPAGPGEVRINLVDVEFFGEGEAHFSMFTSTSQVHMATSDGIGSDDFYLMGRGDHRHMNWVFTAKGVYRIQFTASMLLVAGDEASRTTSEPQSLLVAVGVPGMELWLLEGGVGPDELGENDSPAGDGVANVLKYALGLPPLAPVSGAMVESEFFEAGGNSFLALDAALNPLAEGIGVWVETSGNLAEWETGAGHTVTLEHTADRIHARDAVAVSGAGRRFIRLAVMRNLPAND